MSRDRAVETDWGDSLPQTYSLLQKGTVSTGETVRHMTEEWLTITYNLYHFIGLNQIMKRRECDVRWIKGWGTVHT